MHIRGSRPRLVQNIVNSIRPGRELELELELELTNYEVWGTTEPVSTCTEQYNASGALDVPNIHLVSL